MIKTEPTYRIRSYVPRGRRTPAQEEAYQSHWTTFGLTIGNGCLNWQEIFDKPAPVYLEIGFGSGHSLLALAEARPDLHFIGVETHQPGIGALLMGIEARQLRNLRIFYGDVNDVLLQAIPDASLAGVQIFFPDPWPKRRHHQRRLIQVPFIHHLMQKLINQGELHFATDWEHYATHMMSVVSSIEGLENLAGPNQFAQRSWLRPVITKFENRALREGRVIRDLQLKMIQRPIAVPA